MAPASPPAPDSLTEDGSTGFWANRPLGALLGGQHRAGSRSPPLVNCPVLDRSHVLSEPPFSQPPSGVTPILPQRAAVDCGGTRAQHHAWHTGGAWGNVLNARSDSTIREASQWHPVVASPSCFFWLWAKMAEMSPLYVDGVLLESRRLGVRGASGSLQEDWQELGKWH